MLTCRTPETKPDAIEFDKDHTHIRLRDGQGIANRTVHIIELRLTPTDARQPRRSAANKLEPHSARTGPTYL